MIINPKLVERLNKKHAKYEDSLQDLWLELWMEEPQLSDVDIELRANHTIESAANKRVRDSKECSSYRDIQVKGHTPKAPNQAVYTREANPTVVREAVVGRDYGAYNADALAQVFEKDSSIHDDEFYESLRGVTERVALNSLSFSDRSLLLEFYDGQTAKDLIGKYGNTEEAVWKRASRAKCRLMKHLRDAEQQAQHCRFPRCQETGFSPAM